MPTAYARGTGQFMKYEPGGSRTCMWMKFEVISGSIDSVDWKTDTIFLLKDILVQNKVSDAA